MNCRRKKKDKYKWRYSFIAHVCVACLGVVLVSEPGKWLETVPDFKHPAAESTHPEEK